VQDFSDKVAVITGGAHGIGFALAERLASEGMKIVLGDIEEPRLKEAEQALRESGADVSALVMDVTEPVQMQALADLAVDAYGGVHVFCNNAGVGGGGLEWEMPLSTWEFVIGVNLWGVIHGIRTFVPLLMKQEAAHIVNTASAAGLVAPPFMSPYNATKHAVVAISESLYHELALVGSNVNVSVLCPAWVKTGIGESERNRPAHLREPVAEEQTEALSGIIKGFLETGMEPEEVADHVLRAIRDERFWILTHQGDEWMTAIEARLDSVKNQVNPDPVALG